MSLTALNEHIAKSKVSSRILNASLAPRLFEEALALLTEITEVADNEVMAMASLMIVARFRHKLGSPSFLSSEIAQVSSALYTSPYWEELRGENKISGLISAVEEKLKELDTEINKVQKEFYVQISSSPD